MKLNEDRRALLRAFGTYVRTFSRSDTKSLWGAIIDLREEDDQLFAALSVRVRSDMRARTPTDHSTPDGVVVEAWAGEAFKLAGEA